MPMPNRNTQSNLQGGFSSGGITTVNGNTYVSNLTVTTRIGNTPNTYKASTSIEFVGEYADNGNEEYEAFIVNQTNPDPNPTTGTVSSSNVDGYRFGFGGQEKSNDVAEGNYTALYWEYDSRIGRRWNVEPLIATFPYLSSYATFSNNPINATDPDGKRFYFVGGAGNDSKGWNYINRFKNIFTQKRIQNFVRVNASGGTNADIAFTFAFRNYGGFPDEKITVGKNGRTEIQLTRREHKQIQKAVDDIVADLTKHPLKDGEQLNLAGYSYGSVLQAQVALRLADKGIKVDNLVLIGSPISDKSPLYKELIDNPNIKKVIRNDIQGDKFSNPKSEGEFLEGAKQNKDPQDKGVGPHFDLARPGAEADKKIGELGDKLKKEGIK